MATGEKTYEELPTFTGNEPPEPSSEGGSGEDDENTSEGSGNGEEG